MTDLSPEARRLLGLARRGDDPVQADRVRVNQHLTKRVALGAGAAGTAFGTAKVASGAAAMSALLGKGLVTGVFITATAVGAWRAANHYVAQRPTAATHLADPAGSRPPQARAVVSRLELDRSLAAPSESSAPTISPETNGPGTVGGSDAPDEPRSTVAPSPGHVARPASDVARTNQTRRNSSTDEQRGGPPAGSPTGAALGDDSTDPLLAETAALREVQRAMTSGQAERALLLLREQNARYRAGALNQERAAAEVFALCSLARTTEARQRAEAFERHWPRSPMIARVRRACDQSARTP